MAINKDGKTRKAGSGRTKGATSLVSIRLGDLKGNFTDDDLIVVGRKFAEKAGLSALGKAVSSPLTAEEKDGIKLTEF